MGPVVRERSKVVITVAEPDHGDMQKTDEIAEAYKRAFGQDSVLRAITAACAFF